MGAMEARAKRIIFLVFLSLFCAAGFAHAEMGYRIWYSANDGGPNWRINSVFMDANIKDGERRLAVDLGPAGSLDSAQAYSQSVLKDAQGFTMWYGGNDGANWRILRAISSDGLNWEKQGLAMALGNPEDFDSMHMVYPFVLKDENIYRMWYTAFDGRTHWHIGYADSADGIIFKNRKMALDIGPANSLDCEHVHAPIVLKQGGIYTMFYAGFGGYPRAWRILRATSSDPLNWSKQGLVLDLGEAGEPDSTNIMPGSVIYSKGIFKMWYWGHGNNWRIFSATSKNGIDWKKQGIALDLGPGRALDSRGLVAPAALEEN